MELVCNDCLHQISFYISKECSKLEQNSERNPYEKNLRTVVTAFRETEKGHEAILNFDRCMNMRSISDPSYCNLNNELHVAYFDAASENMQKSGEQALINVLKTNNFALLTKTSLLGYHVSLLMAHGTDEAIHL